MHLNGPALVDYQLGRLNRLFRIILPKNPFYAAKLSGLPRELSSLEQFESFPFTFKEELVDGAIDSKYAANLTWDPGAYSRLHRTSGTRGRPLIVLDTQDDWDWWMTGWEYVLDAARLTCEDRVLMAFSFGPFIGFWSAYDAVVRRGALCARRVD